MPRWCSGCARTARPSPGRAPSPRKYWPPRSTRCCARPRRKRGAQERSLSLGRVVELPGLSAALAEAARASPGWDAASGRPRRGDVNGFVAGLLQQSAVLKGLLPAYSIESVSVEKVLVPTRRAVRERTATDGIPDGRLPYDAQLWVRVKQR